MICIYIYIYIYICIHTYIHTIVSLAYNSCYMLSCDTMYDGHLI